MVRQLRDIDESDLNGMELCWEVYQRQGCYNGLSAAVRLPGDGGTVTLLTEFSGSKFYTSESIQSPYMTTEAETKTTLNGDRVETESETTTTLEYLTQTVQVASSVEYSRVSRDEYAADLEMTTETASTYSEDFSEDLPENMLQDSTQTAEVSGGIEFRFGSGLKTLKESPRWRNIYKEDWGSLQDMLGGSFPLPGFSMDDLVNL
jgi:hypothetical protein